MFDAEVYREGIACFHVEVDSPAFVGDVCFHEVVVERRHVRMCCGEAHGEAHGEAQPSHLMAYGSKYIIFFLYLNRAPAH